MVAPAATLRFATAEDLTAVSSFLAELGGEGFEERFPGRTVRDFYEWKYERNPYGAAIVGVATTTENRIVSTAAASPKRVWTGGKEILCYELGDFLTASDFRKRGLFSSLVQSVCAEAFQGGAAFVYVRPNGQSFPILQQHGFFEAAAVHQRKYVDAALWLSRKTGAPARLLTATGISRLLRPGRCGSGDIDVQPVSRFDEEATEFWSRVRSEYTFALVRDATYLNWRYAESTAPFLMWIARRQHAMVGFLAAFADSKGQLAYILDLFTAKHDAATARVLLAVCLDEMARRGVPVVYTITAALEGSAATKLLQSVCRWVEKPPMQFALRMPQDMPPFALPEEGCHITFGDFDAF